MEAMAVNGAEVPVTGDEDDRNELANLVRSLQDRIGELEEKLKEKREQTHDPETLKPIDVKDIEKPDKYDNNISKFNVWFDKFRDLVTNRHPNWYKLLKAVEGQGKRTIRDQAVFFQGLDDTYDKSYTYIKAQADMYAQQLKSYLRTYTEGELHARIIQTDHNHIMELMRELIYKGKNRNPNRLIDLKSKALSPPRAMKSQDLPKVLSDWKHVRQQIMEEDPSYKMDEETMQTILLKIMPMEYVKDMRERLTDGKFDGDYYGFEQELFDEISTRKMDEESRKHGGTIHAVGLDTNDQEEIEIWSNEWQCYICGIASKRGRDENNENEDYDTIISNPHKMSKTEQQAAPMEVDKGKGRGKRPIGPCWTCGGAHLQKDCPHAAGKGPFPTSTAWSSWRPASYPGPTAAQWNAWMPKPWKGKGKGKGGKGKGKGTKGKGKGKGPNGDHHDNINEVHWQPWGPPLGHVQGPQYDEHHFMQDLIPICAVRNEYHQWEETCKAKTKGVHTHNRFDLLQDSSDEEHGYEESMKSEEHFPGIIEATVPSKTTKMLKMPKRCSQRAMKEERNQRGKLIGGVLATVAEKEDFLDKAEEIRRDCQRERQVHAPATPLRHECPINAMNNSEEWAQWYPGWQYLALTVDSGAAETVIPHMLVKDHPIYETTASKSGLNYASATGDPIPNLGEQKLPLLTNEGSLRAMTFQAAPVDRPLGSVKRMCNSGHTVVFDDEGSYVLNKLTGEINWMREDNGNYVMDLWVMPNGKPGFQRQRSRVLHHHA